MADFTATQGRYLAFIHAYTELHGYWFDFGDDWFHQVQVERIEQAIPTVTYPRVIKRVGKSPPQYLEE